jgi:hypothetical protein
MKRNRKYNKKLVQENLMNGLKYIVLLFGIGLLFAQEPPEEFQFNQSTQQAFYFFGTATIGGESLDGDDWIGSFRNGYCSNPVAANEEICDILGEK